MIESDMSNPIVQEARGIILEVIEEQFEDYSTRKVTLLAHSFDKFFNYTEGEGIKVLEHFDWGNYTFQEKRDGSLLRVWYYKGKWRVSTSGTIDAKKATIDIPSNPYGSFEDMFLNIVREYGDVYFINLNENYTYSFEMTGPENKIVVDYDKNELTLIGIRDNITNKELDIYKVNPFKSIKTPRRWAFDKDMETALMNVNSWSNFEGLVLTDAYFNRVKIKTEEYVALHRMADETSSDRGVMSIILNGTIDDVVNRLPHLQARVDRIQEFLRQEAEGIEKLINSIDYSQDRKTIALQIKDNEYSMHGFNKIKNPDYDYRDYFVVDNVERFYKKYKDKYNIVEEIREVE